MEKQPALQMFKKKDLEVLMLDDTMDEPCIQKLDLKLDESAEEKKRFNKLKDMYKPLTEWWKSTISDLTEKGAMKDSGLKIDKVEVSKRLTESPVVVVASQFGYSAQQEKVMKAQMYNTDNMGAHQSRKILEINPNHPVIIDLLAKVKANKEDAVAKDTASMLFQAATMESGFDITDPTFFVSKVYRMMSKDLGVDPDAPITEVEVPEEEEEEEGEDDEDDDDEKKDDDDKDDKDEDKDDDKADAEEKPEKEE